MSRSVAIALASISLFVASQTMVWVLVPVAAAELGLSNTFVGAVLATPAFVSIFASIPFAALSDRTGRLPSMIGGATSAVIAPLILAFGRGSPVILLLGAGAFAFEGALFFGPALAYLSEICSPREHARIQGLNGGLQGMSTVVGSLLAGVVTDLAGFVAAMTIASGLGCAALILIVPCKESGRRRTGCRPSLREMVTVYESAIGLVRSHPQIQMAAIIDMLYVVLIMVVGTSFLTLFATAHLRLSLSMVGVLLGIRNLVGTLTSWLFGPSVKRFGLFSVAFASTVISSVALGLTSWCPDTTALFILVAAQGLGFGMNIATYNTLIAADTRPTERAMGFASGALVASGSGVLLPPLLGMVSQVLGLGSVFVVGAVIGGLSLLGLTVIARRERYVLAVVPLEDDDPE